MRSIMVVSVAALFAGCEQDVQVGGLQEIMVLPASPKRDLDILFVVDSSPSMLDEQASLAESFPLMIDMLNGLSGGLPDLHIGVVTTDLGMSAADGSVWQPSTENTGPGSCNGVGEDGSLRRDIPELNGGFYISDVAGPGGARVRNYTGELRDVFSKLALVGANGCGAEQPIAAAKRALENPANAGFVRDNANLAVVIVTDEDDCSVRTADFFSEAAVLTGAGFACTKFGVTCDDGGQTPAEMAQPGMKAECHASDASTTIEEIAPFAAYLRNLKDGDPYAVMVAVIAGGGRALETTVTDGIPSLVPACGTMSDWALPTPRLEDLVDEFPSRGVMTSICDDTLSLQLTEVGYMARQLVGDPCVEAPDVALRSSCEVKDGTAGNERRLARCRDESSTDCWRLRDETTGCLARATSRLEVLRSSEPAPTTYSHLHCPTK